MAKADKEKKKIVFKVRFSNQESIQSDSAEPQLISEWNYTRIAIAGAVFALLITVGINILGNDDNAEIPQKTLVKQVKTDTAPRAAQSTQAVIADTKKQITNANLPETKNISSENTTQISGGLVRAQLAKGIWENEPFAEINGSVKVNSKEATGIYYFTELENMKGKTIFHIWKYNGKTIFKKKREIQDNNWKTYTSKLFTKRSIGSWTVETIDSHNQQLNLITFKVVAAN